MIAATCSRHAPEEEVLISQSVYFFGLSIKSLCECLHFLVLFLNEKVFFMLSIAATVSAAICL